MQYELADFGKPGYAILDLALLKTKGYSAVNGNALADVRLYCWSQGRGEALNEGFGFCFTFTQITEGMIMNKLFATATLGLLTMGSLAMGLAFKVEAVTERTVQPVEKSVSSPQLIEAEQPEDATQLAYAQYCEVNYVNGVPVSCCMDDAGNWACVW